MRKSDGPVLKPEEIRRNGVAVVTMKNLLESGVHFGHQTKRWDPRMKKFIFTERNGIHIIDLQKTITAIKDSYEFVRKNVHDGKSVLFVGTKKQAQMAVEKEAKRCGMYYINNRWLGGMLTNFSTIKKSIMKLKKIEKMEIDGTFESLTKKEVSLLMKKKTALEKNLGGIKDMKELPGVIFIIDTKNEAIAVAEAVRCGIPIIAIVDTNCNPEGITFPIPGNDDAIRAITLFTQIIANAVVEADNEIGLQVIENLQDDDFAIDTDQAATEDSSVEKVSLAAAVGSEDEEKSEKFTSEDYSNYVPEEAAKSDTATTETDDKTGIDTDKFYKD